MFVKSSHVFIRLSFILIILSPDLNPASSAGISLINSEIIGSSDGENFPCINEIPEKIIKAVRIFINTPPDNIKILLSADLDINSSGSYWISVSMLSSIKPAILT